MLKDCPFCGAKAKLLKIGGIDHVVECTKCKANMVNDTCLFIDLTKAWNTRYITKTKATSSSQERK